MSAKRCFVNLFFTVVSLLSINAMAITCNFRVVAEGNAALSEPCSASATSSSGLPVKYCAKYRIPGAAQYAQGLDASEYANIVSFALENPTFFTGLAVCDTAFCIGCDFSLNIAGATEAPIGTQSPTSPKDLQCNARYLANDASTSSSPCSDNSIGDSGPTVACVRYATPQGRFTGPASAQQLADLQVSFNVF
jgi:hypothetical protein